ncbi:MAG TPA: magnesium transporter [Bacteroidia bacterium]|jgi:magnesium transporter|nr:magnesium transporter [Bacteroidia bacterium]
MAYQVTDEFISKLREALAARNENVLHYIFDELHPADSADILNQLSDEEAVEVYKFLPEETAAEVILLIEEDKREKILDQLSPKEIAEEIIDNLASDDAADVLGELDQHEQDEVLSHVEDTEQAGDIVDLLNYDEDTAGGLMAKELVKVHLNNTVRQCVKELRTQAEEVKNIYTIYVVDDDEKLVGLLSLKNLLTVPLNTPIKSVYNPDVISVKTNTPAEEVGTLMDKYDLVVVPVVDGINRLVGRITFDDIVDVIREETTEDVQKMGGVEALDEPYMTTPFWEMIKKRAGWLIILFVGETFTASAMAHFDAQLKSAVILANFIPLIISSGGNTGSQATSLIIRALSLGEIKVKDWWKIVSKELRVGITLGIILGFIGVIRVYIWSWITVDPVLNAHVFLISITIGITLIGVVAWGTLVGSILPLFLKRIGLDPAASSAPFVATLVDVTGIVIYFTIAILFLNGILL